MRFVCVVADPRRVIEAAVHLIDDDIFRRAIFPRCLDHSDVVINALHEPGGFERLVDHLECFVNYGIGYRTVG